MSEIVLSKMFSGSYLLDNLGHEVINLYRCDNGCNYVYLNDDGMFSRDHRNKVKTVLFVKSIGNSQYQVIGKAEGLTDIFDPNNSVDVERRKQINEIVNKDICYGGTLLHAIFVGNTYQYVYMTFKAETMLQVKDGVEVIISFQKGACTQQSNNKIIVSLSDKGLLASGGKEYFDKANTPNDYVQLDNIINNQSLWDKPFPKYNKQNKNKTMTEMAMRSLFTHRISKHNDLNKLFK